MIFVNRGYKSLYKFYLPLSLFIFFFNMVQGSDIPSEDLYEDDKSIIIPKTKEKESKERNYYDFFEPQETKYKEIIVSLIENAEKEKVYFEKGWLDRLRYKRNLFSGFHSEVVSDSFFLSKDGMGNPRKELLASIRAIFATKRLNVQQSERENDIYPECVFPERFHWLRQRFQITNTMAFKPDCKRFQNWKNSLQVKNVKLVFASHYLQAPASMFGHTFLKLDGEQSNLVGSKFSELLDYGIGYAADPGDISPVHYVFGGIAGGYNGKFSIFPYYMKVNEYNDLESRDLWEYSFQLNEEERDILVRHLWEMGNAEFPYYFQKENCAYQLLRLLEVVKGDLNLGQKYQLTLSPQDLLRLLVKTNLFVNVNPVHRPSLLNQIQSDIMNLTEEEKETFFELVEEMNVLSRKQVSSDSLKLKEINMETQTAIVPILINTYLYKFPNSREEGDRTYYNRLLSLQSSLPIKEEVKSVEPSMIELNQKNSPEKAHGGSRISFAYGNSSLGNFIEIGTRIAQHDLLNANLGLPKHSEIQFFNVKARQYEDKKTELTSLDLVKLVSLTPYNSISQKLSYLFAIGSDTVQMPNTEVRKQVGNLEMLGGYSLASEFTKGMNVGVLSFLGGARLQSNSDFRFGMRYGPQLTLNYQYEIGKWKLVWMYSYVYFQPSQNLDFFHHTLRIRYEIQQDHEIRFELAAYPLYNELLLGYHYFY
ncbi:MAG: DUF4105 domain-containing protein [Leptospira sp.]|nr:DUF4105 domain-containing protein [Leptospira sp.]